MNIFGSFKNSFHIHIYVGELEKYLKDIHKKNFRCSTRTGVIFKGENPLKY